MRTSQTVRLESRFPICKIDHDWRVTVGGGECGSGAKKPQNTESAVFSFMDEMNLKLVHEGESIKSITPPQS